MKPTKISLIAALIASVLVAYAPTTQAQDSKEAPKGEGRPNRPGGGGPEGAKERMDRMTEALKLTDEQKPKVEAAMKEMGEKMRSIRQDSSLSDDQKKEKAKAAREELDKKMKGILTAEQYTKYEKSRPGPGGPGGGRPGGAKGGGAKPEKN